MGCLIEEIYLYFLKNEKNYAFYSLRFNFLVELILFNELNQKFMEHYFVKVNTK